MEIEPTGFSQGEVSMNSRDAILARVYRSTRPPADPVQYSQQITVADAAGIARFARLAADTQMTVEQVSEMAAVPGAVAQYLAEHNLAARVSLDVELNIAAVDWQDAGVATPTTKVAADGDVYVGVGLAAVAECGALVISSRPGHALANEFLAQTHIAVLRAERVITSFGALWALLRGDPDDMPREFCLVTGPSRTADLGVPAKLGAHGPARVHVLVVGA